MKYSKILWLSDLLLLRPRLNDWDMQNLIFKIVLQTRVDVDLTPTIGFRQFYYFAGGREVTVSERIQQVLRNRQSE